MCSVDVKVQLEEVPLASCGVWGSSSLPGWGSLNSELWPMMRPVLSLCSSVPKEGGGESEGKRGKKTAGF